MYKLLARQLRPCVRCAISPKGASKLKILLLSRTLSDKSAGGGHDVYGHSDRKVCITPAEPPSGTQRLATEPSHGHPETKQDQLLELMKLTEEVQQKVMKLNRDVRAGMETMPIHLRKILIGLQKAHEGVDTAFELDENQKICRAFQAAGICFSIRDDIRYLFMREFRERNTFIHIDTSGNIKEFDERTTLFPIVKELTIQRNVDEPVVTLYLSHHFIFLLEEKEDSTAETNTCTEKEFRVSTRFLYSQGGELLANATILNPNAWFIRDVERGFVNFFIRSRFQDVCIHAGQGSPLEAVNSDMCRRNLECQTVGRLDC